MNAGSLFLINISVHQQNLPQTAVKPVTSILNYKLMAGISFCIATFS